MKKIQKTDRRTRYTCQTIKDILPDSGGVVSSFPDRISTCIISSPCRAHCQAPNNRKKQQFLEHVSTDNVEIVATFLYIHGIFYSAFFSSDYCFAILFPDNFFF